MEIEILPAEGAFVTVTGYTPNFAAVNQETNLSMSFKNVGVDPTDGITTVTLSCTDERFVILQGTTEFDILPAEETITLTDAFSFIVAEGVEDGTKFQINVDMNCGEKAWSGKAFITAGQAILDYEGAEWNGAFVPGEDLLIVANFKNIGHYMASNAVATITCDNPYVNLYYNEFSVGTIDPSGTAPCVFQMAIDPECPESESIALNFVMQADGGLTMEGSITLRNSCNVVVVMNDSYGDGWNGNKLRLSFDDNTPNVELTFENGFSATETLRIGKGVHVTLTWINGQYTSECSFVVKYENGDIIYQGSNLSSGVLYEFDCDCESEAPANTYDPVENLEAAVEIGTVILTWDAPEGAESYTILRNGIEIAQIEESTYTDEVFSEINFTYCVIANYRNGSSYPQCTEVKGELSIEESTSEFSIYPNPTNSTLFINGGDAEYSYAMYNGMGQVVTMGNAKGTEQINVNGLTMGVYFLRLTSGTQVSITKVVVE